MKKPLLLTFGLALSVLGFNKAQAQTYNYTGAMQTYVVPAGVTSLYVQCWGAEGSIGLGAAGGTAGMGGYSSGNLTVTPGQTLNLYVGGTNGYNGGGTGGNIGAGNGGGASDIRVGGTTLGDRVIVAGGGGGGGATGCASALAGGNGGNGGGDAGTNGASSADGFGGFGGTVGVGGAEGDGCPQYLGTPGLANGTGGDGQGCCCSTTPGGGGGGGGYITGGGGGGGSAGTPACGGNDKGGGGGGAGGSSWTGTLTNPTITNGLQNGDGVIIIAIGCGSTDVTAPTPDVAQLPDLNDQCQVMTLTSPTATDICAGAIVGTTTTTAPITAPGLTVITWTFDDGNGNVSTQTQNVLNPTIDNTLTVTGTTIESNESAAAYQWIDCDNANSPIAGELYQDYTPVLTGNYAVELTVMGCVDTSACQLIDFTGIEELMQNNSGKELVKIVDMMGRETKFTPNTPLIFIYSDGTRESVMGLEK